MAPSARNARLTKHPPGCIRGFTLVELLVASFVLALLAVMAYRGLTAVQENERHLAAVAGRWQDLVRAVERLGRDLRQAGDRPGRDGSGRAVPAFLGVPPGQEQGQADGAQLAFSRIGGDGLDTRRLGYRWRDGRLELLIWPLPEAAGMAAQAYPLLHGVRSFRLAYLDAAGRWLESWPVAGGRGRPRAVRLQLALDEGIAVERIFDLP